MALEKIGAMWKRKSKAGKDYFTIQIQGFNNEEFLVCFPNKRKKNKQPDFIIYKDVEQESNVEDDDV